MSGPPVSARPGIDQLAPSPDEILPDRPTRGRGAVSNRTGRYEPHDRFRVDDGWLEDRESAADAALPQVQTTVSLDTSRSVITRNNSPDIGFDQSINPYRGCEHGCSYCFARPSHAYLGHSPGLDFETRLYAKPDAAALLRDELSQPGYNPSPIAMGTNTDPYQPVEKTLEITRSILGVMSACHHPVSVVTKSALVLRDLDILAPMAARNLAAVGISVTTLDAKLARAMEPRAATPARRLQTIEALSAAGIPVIAMVAPIIPGLNDHEIEDILAQAAAAGASAAAYILLRLPLEVSGLFREWLEVHRPGSAKRVLSRLRRMRSGKLYDTRFGLRMSGTGDEAELLRQRFHIARRRHGLAGDLPDLDTGLFDPPGANTRQLTLF